MARRLGTTQAKALAAELIAIRERLDQLIKDIVADGEAARAPRNYDVPAPDPAEIEERYGVAPSPEGEAPAWFQDWLHDRVKPQDPA